MQRHPNGVEWRSANADHCLIAFAFPVVTYVEGRQNLPNINPVLWQSRWCDGDSRTVMGAYSPLIFPAVRNQYFPAVPPEIKSPSRGLIAKPGKQNLNKTLFWGLEFSNHLLPGRLTIASFHLNKIARPLGSFSMCDKISNMGGRSANACWLTERRVHTFNT